MTADVPYRREERDGVTVVWLLRPLSLREALTVMEEVARDGTSDRRLWNVGTHFDFSMQAIRQLSEAGRRLWPAPARVAYVGGGEVFYGLLRMYEAYRDQEGYETRAFRSEEDAMAWLLS